MPVKWPAKQAGEPRLPQTTKEYYPIELAAANDFDLAKVT